jgi:hypothetical protein
MLWMADYKLYWKTWQWSALSYISAFAWRDWRKQRSTSVTIASLQAEIRNRNLQNVKQKCQLLNLHIRELSTNTGITKLHYFQYSKDLEEIQDPLYSQMTEILKKKWENISW